MFKKLNIRTLIIIFSVLLAIVTVNKLILSKKGDRTFRNELVIIDVNGVTGILLYPRSEKQQEIKISKSGNGWQVETDGMKANADTGIIMNMLTVLENIKPKRLAATDQSKWEKYEVNDSLGTRIKIIEQDQTTLDIIIGKFTFKQQGKVITSYVRLSEDDNIYAVDGILGMTFNQGFNYWRNKTVIRGNMEDWTQLSFQYPADSSFRLTRQNDKWMLDGILSDSAKTAGYINKIANLSNSNFVDDFKPVGIQPRFSLKIEGNNFPIPIEINAYAADSVHQYIITSSLNLNTSFSDAKGKLVGNIFVSKESFMQIMDVESE